jgi:IclR family pca regulon transcriptional regulator
MAVLEDLDLVYLLRVHGGEVERNWLPVDAASRLPAYPTAAGKVLLAGLPEEERRDRVQRISFDDAEVPTDWTAAMLESELLTTRQDCLGINDGESALGIQAIAVGVENASGEVVAALNLVGWQPHISIRRMLVDHLDALQRIAEISVMV